MKCNHDLAEMETACAMDGVCPICLLSRIRTLGEGIRQTVKEIEWYGQAGRIFQHTDAVNIIGKLQKLLMNEEVT